MFWWGFGRDNSVCSAMEAGVTVGRSAQPHRELRDLDPPYGPELQQRCLEIRQTGVGPMASPSSSIESEEVGPALPARERITDEHADLTESLKSLGLAATAEEVQTALGQLYPDGWAEVERGEVIRRLFLQLQGKK